MNRTEVVRQGLEHARAGRLFAAEERLVEALSQASHPDVAANLAAVYQLQGRPDEGTCVLRAHIPPDGPSGGLEHTRCLPLDRAPWPKPRRAFGWLPSRTPAAPSPDSPTQRCLTTGTPLAVARCSRPQPRSTRKTPPCAFIWV